MRVIVRIAVYALRRVFAPGGWLRSSERFISWMDRSVSLGDMISVERFTGQISKMTARYATWCCATS